MCVSGRLRVCAFEKERDFYGLFPLGRRACGGQSQLDMPERFLLDRKMGGKERGKRRAEIKSLSIDWMRDKDQERKEERETL